MASLPRLSILLAVGWTCAVLPSGASADAARCLEQAGLVRIARVRAPDGAAVYARVVADEDGVPSRVVRLADASTLLAEVFDRTGLPDEPDAPVWSIAEDERATRICSPVRLPQEVIDAETRVIVAVGLNYAAHAEEAGGGDVFLFPKPVEPTAPYQWVAPPSGVSLLDYEVELAYVLLEDIDLANLPTREAFLERTAFFVANDITDREPIIMNAGFSGPGTGFVESKGQPNFLPTGPWMVRGSELFGALERCNEDGLGIHLEVDEGEGFVERQSSTTAAMIVKPLALLAKTAAQIDASGLRTEMPVERAEGTRFYPFAVQADETVAPILPAGSIVVTGTPDGVALQAPSVPGVLVRGLLHLRGPFEQFRQEELARAAEGAPGGYLVEGDVVRASIDALGSQMFRIAEAGSPIPHDLCEEEPHR